MTVNQLKQPPSLKAFLDELEDYNCFLTEVVKAQEDKVEALLSHDNAVIEHSVARQQALIMQMGKREQRRQQLQKDAGLDGLTFSQIEEQADPKERQRVRDCHTLMQDLVSQIQFYNDKAMRLVETNLQVLNLSMAPWDRVELQGYDGHGKQAVSGSAMPMFEAKV